MQTHTPVYLPQSGPNDTTATIVEWSRAPGQWVQKAEVLGAAETTKSVFDLEAPSAGTFWPLLPVGAEVAVGSMIAVLGSDQSSQEEVRSWLAAQEKDKQTPALATGDPSTLRKWTVKAELLAKRYNVDLGQVPATGDRITEADVQALIDLRAAEGQAAGHAAARSTAKLGVEAAGFSDLVDDRFPSARVQRLLVIGGGNGAVQIIDTLTRLPNQRAVGILDDNSALHGKTVAGVPVWGPVDIERAIDMVADRQFDAAVISISTSIQARTRIFEQWLARGLTFANIVHPSCVVGINVNWGQGNIVMALCHFGACATIGDNNFFSAYCSIEHHCRVDSHCSFGPAVVTSSRVHIGDRVRFGTGIYVEPGIQIGEDSILASGLAITQHIPANSVVKAHTGYSIRPRS